jgi:integrase
MQYYNIAKQDFASLIEGKDSREIEKDIINFIIFLKNKHYSLASQKVYLAALIHFYSINDINVRRKKIAKFLSNDDDNDNNQRSLSEQGQVQDQKGLGDGDKPYTREQILKLLEFSDLRTKAIILLLSSTGMRLGGLESLKIGDLTPVPTHNLYQVRVYANSKSNKHYTFCTPECRKAVDNYIDFRKSCGEVITPKSPVIRRFFDKRDVFAAAKDIRPVTYSSIKRAITNVLYASGIRTPVTLNIDALNARRETMLTHGFRKFFDTVTTNAGVNPIYIETMLNHKLEGVKDSYFLPQPNADGIYMDISEGHEKSPGYLDAIDYLTINEENRLKKKINQLMPKIDRLDELEYQLNCLDKKLSELM